MSANENDRDRGAEIPDDLPDAFADEARVVAESAGANIDDADKELQDLEDIDTGDYPDAARENARMALEAKEETGDPNDCGTRVGWERANQLANGEDLTEDTIERMASFTRHEDNKEQGEEGRADCGWMMWKAWGGDEGIEWAERKSEQFDEARQNAALSHGRCLGEGVTDEQLSHAPEWDRPLLEMFRGVSDPNSDPNRALVDFAASGTPEFVLDRIRDAVNAGAIFSDIEGVPGDELMGFRELFKDNLATDDFTLDDVTDAVMEFTDKSRDSAEITARTEMSSVMNTAREEGYQERGEADDLFYWTGAEPGDDRQTEACRLLIERTNPYHGGEPVPLEELRSLLSWAAEQDPDLDASMVRADSWVIHIGERSTFAKAPPNWEQL